ncbi:MAG: Gfo/Idh/MocA family oxidoreductase [Gemmatimonadota bacterium]
MSGKFRVGILGTGGISQVVHLPTLTRMRGVEVSCVADRDAAKAGTLAERFGVPEAHASDEDLLGDAGLDAVVVATPSHLHEDHAIAALRAGKHVLVEKPIALSAEGAKRVLEAAEEAGKVLMVALNNRYRPDARALRPFIKGGELGEVFHVRVGSLKRKTRAARPTWRHDPESAGGGALMDLGVQALDLALWLLGYPGVERVVAHAHRPSGSTVEDAASALMRCQGGAAISLNVTWSLFEGRDRQYLDALGTQGSASLTPLSVHKEVEQGVLDVTPHVAPGRTNLYTSSYREMLADFVLTANEDRAYVAPSEQIELMEVMASAYRSIEQGAEVVR